MVSYSEVGANRSKILMDFTDCVRLQSDNLSCLLLNVHIALFSVGQPFFQGESELYERIMEIGEKITFY